MLPAAGHKGSALALLVDIMSGGVAGSNFSFEAGSFSGTAGGPPDVGQVIIAIDPAATMGPTFLDRIEIECNALLVQDGASPRRRPPGLCGRGTAAEGVQVPGELLTLLTDYADTAPRPEGRLHEHRAVHRPGVQRPARLRGPGRPA